VWATRRARALRLAAEVPHAAEILGVYATLTGVQERIAAEVPVDRWLAAGRSHEAGPSATPLLRLDRLPLEELLPLFTRFLEQMVDVGTDVMKQQVKRLLAGTKAERRAVLVDAIVDTDAASVHPRAFLEAIATTLATTVASDPSAGAGPIPAVEGATATRCRVCGGQPVVDTLRDHAGVLGVRALVCGLCGSEQRIPRLTCAHCGETNAERLRVHTAESIPHVRVDECGNCRRYLKCVDLRRRGDAVPIVEELATVELDLWASEQGLTKLHTNVFGL
jgi:formate dehydrogenase accessory protein FdhE